MKSNRLQTTDYRLQTGFTLVELIIYLGIVALLLTSVSYLIIDLMSGQTGSRADEEVNYNVRLIADRLAADIAAAQQIVSLTSDRLTLDLPGDDVTYEFPSGRTVLTRLVGSGDPTVVNTGPVDVSGSFTDRSLFTRSRNVGVGLSVVYRNPGNLSDYQASSTIEFAIELRGRK